MKGIIKIYNETAEIISDTVNFKIAVSGLTTLQMVIDDIISHRPTYKVVKDFDRINIFIDSRATYIAPGNGTFTVNFDKLDNTKITGLLSEFDTLSKA